MLSRFWAMYRAFDRIDIAPSPHGVTTVTLSNPGKLNAVDAAMHRQLSEIWPVLDVDPHTKVVVLRGEGANFSAGGDLDMLAEMTTDATYRRTIMSEAKALVHNMVNCSVVVVSAIEGHAVGAGLAAALLADISVAARSARLCDGHTRLGVAAGDHAALLWPLLCGMAKAKKYLLTCEPISGEEAERIGLVSECVDDTTAVARATEIAQRLARGSADAIRSTKSALNGWLVQALPLFDHSLALEMLGFAGPDAAAGVQALQLRRTPEFG